jgi:transcriptional regulator with XRE-family HTH domain
MQIDAKKLGANIKRLRLKKEISQEELARAAGLKLSNVAKLEGGFNTNPTLATLIAVAKIISSDSIDKLLK